jgi:hypothetical protein
MNEDCFIVDKVASLCSKSVFFGGDNFIVPHLIQLWCNCAVAPLGKWLRDGSVLSTVYVKRPGARVLIRVHRCCTG